ncbi:MULTISPECIES: DeoR/GlpR family DNA-binding transcription regulator [Kosmotoga]|uniref:Transcriptional regulator, DeoR family n=1 Tax=Kosmotoga olearia (strain ATCC BAA-1733 / DSM 21960 / TBF 19.5.1) TaxID=521045 RepID=C5CIF2_KOSOT|nr:MULTISPECIES: DeoR/GlpR family DNA-binding transcription regulator [Kosmotoga]ACR78886.1 transcriptional regulator, DeoR family [Kosmotoga olearia TBF 19.5.1]MDI3523983.1 hypothetical protein [Kosmotoga sp.]MDK2954057.1 hypothetical protein [Kosmotoga sp.]OAA24865.1 hypothetical protein DU53_00685 [Kosmotoga sp. DU53]
MNKSESLKIISEIIRKEGNVSIKMVSEKLGVSESTARRYINELIKISSLPLKRVHGGVILDTGKGSLELMFDTKLSMNAEEKKRIAQKAVNFVEDGDSIIIDSGSTAFYMAKYLSKKRGIKVISVDIRVTEELAKNPDIETYIIGGIVRPGYYSIGGELAVETIKNFSVEKVFLTVDAIDLENGITNSSMFEVYVKRALINAGKTVILLADSSKIGKKAFVKVAPIESVDIIITTPGIDADTLKQLEDKGVRIVIV